MDKPGTLVVISAPSGAGKHTVLEPVLARDRGIEYSVSATTRSPRPGEIDGVHYVFLEEPEFRRRVAAGAFAEWAEVHGHLYGTLWAELNKRLDSGKDVILEIDVQGMRNVKALGKDMVTVFLMPPSVEELERRLRFRGTDDEATIALRLANARTEMAARHAFDYIVVNETVENAVADLLAIVRAQRLRATRQP